MTRESSNGHEQQYNVELVIDQIVLRYQARPTALIMVLQDIQKHFRYLPEDALREVARRMNLPIAQIYSVATFYRAFSLKPKGAHHICVCTGTACHVRQAAVIVDNLGRALGIEPGGTTPDGQISMETVNCLGACALGPLVTVDEQYYGNMTVTKMNEIIQEIRSGVLEPAAQEVAL